MNKISKKQAFMLIAAGSVLLAAVVWLIILESGSYSRSVCKQINTFGYHLSPADLYSRSYGSDVSIRELIDEELDTVVRFSRDCGFSADINKHGAVELMLYDIDDSHVMVIWLVDKNPELVFIEDKESGDICPINRS